MDQQAVIVTLKLSDDEWGTEQDHENYEVLDERLMEVIDESGVGEYDGMGRGMGVFEIYAYGPNADALFEVMAPLLRSAQVREGSFAVKRYGDIDAPEVRVDL